MISPRWRKVLRDLKDNRSRTVLSVLSIAVGVIAFGGMLIARGAIVDNLDLAYQSSNPSDITLDLDAFDQDLIRWVKTQPGVKDAAGSTVLNGVIKKSDGKDQDITIYAYAAYDAIEINKFKNFDGQYPPARGEFALERGNASLYNMRYGEIAHVRLTTDQIFPLRYTGQVYDVNAPSGPLATHWNLYITQRTLADLNVDARATRLAIQTIPGISVAQKYALADRLKNELARRGKAVRNISVNERGEHWAASIVNGGILMLVMVGAAALVLSGFLIVNVVNGLLLSQKRIIGIMKIVGADRWQIFGIYIVMMASLGALALVIAMPLSAALGGALASFMAVQVNFDVVKNGFTPAIALLEIGVALLVPISFSASPIWSALRVTAAQAISEEKPMQRANMVEKLLAHLRNVPRTIILAFRSLFRNNLRLVATMLTLIAAGAIFTSIMNLRNGMPVTITRNIGINTADVTVSLGSPIMRISAINRALQLDGVIYAEGWIATQATVVRTDGDSSTIPLNGGEATSRFVEPPLLPGSKWLSVYSQDTRDEIVFTQNALDSEPNLKVGDQLKLKHGDDTHSFLIIGFIWGQGTAGYAHYQTVSHFAGSADMATSLHVLTTEKTSAYTNQTADRLRQAFESAHITVVDSQSRVQLIEQVLSTFNIIVTLMIMLASLIAIVGGLGLAGTMSLSVMERTREIGVMRAVGAESPDLRFMFVVEGLFTGLLSAVIAFILSVPLSSLLGKPLGAAFRIGVFDTQLNWTGYALWLLIVSVVSVIASITPAIRASRISIREALAYE